MDVKNSRLPTAGLDSFFHHCGASDAPPVILLHGSGPGANAMSNWVHALPFLGERYRAIAPDIAGFGESQHHQPPTGAAAWIDVWTAQIIALMDGLGIAKAHLVGNSMGGGVTLQLLRRHPQRFERIVLMGAVGAPFTATPGLQRGWGYYRTGTEEELAYLVRKFLHEPLTYWVATWTRLPSSASDWSCRTAFAASSSACFPVTRRYMWTLSWCRSTNCAPWSTRRWLPTAGRIFSFPTSTSLYVAERMPNAQLHMFHHCGHWIQIEQRQAFNQLVLDFLDGRFG